MADFVENVDDILKNLKTLRKYLVSSNDKELVFARQRLRRGHNLVAANVDGDVVFGPSRVVGYKDITLRKHNQLKRSHDLDGKKTDRKIMHVLGKKFRQIKHGDDNWEGINESYLMLCEKMNVDPTNCNRKFWDMGLDQESEAPDRCYREGKLSFYVSTRYERSEAARKACIKAHGTSCVVCKFDFERVYGEHGKGFIHVHHLKPLGSVRDGVCTNSKKDLVPVCPNCHYMLHRGNRILPPKELKQIMKKQIMKLK